MTTSIIDCSLHTSSFPSTYTGQGTLIGNPVNGGDIRQLVAGTFTSNGNTIQLNNGFAPMKVRIMNNTDGISWEWQYGMPAANSIKTTYGGSLASVVDTGSAITFTSDNGQNPGNVESTTLSATLAGTAKSISYWIEG